MFLKNERLFIVKNPLHSKYPPERKRYKIQERIEEDIKPLNTYLWLHGIGFTAKKNYQLRTVTLTLASLIVSLVFDVNLIYWIVTECRQLKQGLNKSRTTFILMMILVLISRFLLYTKRRKFNYVFRRLAVVYSWSVDKYDFIKAKLVSALLANVVVALYMTGFRVYTIIVRKHRKTEADNYHFSEILQSLSIFLLQLCIFCNATTITFALASYILKTSIRELRIKFSNGRSSVDEHLYESYSELMRLIRLVNNELHSAMLIDSVIVLTIAFREMYTVLFDFQGEFHFIVSHVIFMGITFFRFVIMCYFASSVTYAISELKFTILQTPLDASQMQRFQYLLYLKDDHSAFKLLGSIPLNNSLVLSTVGSILTYGIIIATLSTNVNP